MPHANHCQISDFFFFSDNTQANTLRSPGTGEPMWVVPPYMAQSSLILQETSFVMINERSRNSTNHAIWDALFNFKLDYLAKTFWDMNILAIIDRNGGVVLVLPNLIRVLPRSV